MKAADACRQTAEADVSHPDEAYGPVGRSAPQLAATEPAASSLDEVRPDVVGGGPAGREPDSRRARPGAERLLGILDSHFRDRLDFSLSPTELKEVRGILLEAEQSASSADLEVARAMPFPYDVLRYYRFFPAAVALLAADPRPDGTRFQLGTYLVLYSSSLASLSR